MELFVQRVSLRRFISEDSMLPLTMSAPVYLNETELNSIGNINSDFDWAKFYNVKQGSREWRALLDGLAQNPQHVEISPQTYVRSMYFRTLTGIEGKEEWTEANDDLIRSSIHGYLRHTSEISDILINVNLSLSDLRATSLQSSQPGDPKWCLVTTSIENVSMHQPSVERFYCAECDAAHINPEVMILRDCVPRFTQYPVELSGSWDVVALSFGDRRYEHPWVVLSVLKTG